MAGKPQAAAGLSDALNSAEKPGAFRITQLPDAAAADRRCATGKRTRP